MIGFRFKLAAGFGALLCLLLTIGAVSLMLLSRNASTLDRILRENFESVGFGQRMKENLDGIEPALRIPPLDSATTRRIAFARSAFARELANEQANLTVPGEKELVDSLARCWALLDSGSDRAEPGLRRAALVEARRLSQRVIDLNLGNILSADGRVRASHAQARLLLIALLAGGVALASGWTFWAARWIARPLQDLTNSVREVGKRNLDLVVAVESRDELGELAAAFNAMASRLREYRDSDRQRLLRVHRTTQMAVDSLPDAVMVATPQGRVELANGAARRLFGAKELDGLDKIAGGVLEEMVREAVRTAQAVEPRSYASALQVFEDGERFFMPKALPILDATGTVAGVTVVLADITQMRRLEEIRTGALSVVSHELRTPLTSLRMSAHLLLDSRLGDLSDRQTELVSTVAEEGERLQRIVDELLDIARSDAGRTLMAISSHPPEEIVRHAVAEWEGAYRDKGVKLESVCAPGMPPMEVDPVRLSHVLSNLLSNALRHTPASGSVRVDARFENGNCLLDVSDTGEGIAPDQIKHVFERFYRVPGQSADTGVGLGLSIVREIVQAHGGEIGVDSEPGRGSRFRISLPMGKATSIPSPENAS
jgi:two-component system, NtrC family, sensor histidine kinase KinB